MADIILHLGAHATDEGLIAGWLARNAPALALVGTQTMPGGAFMHAIAQALADAAADAPAALALPGMAVPDGRFVVSVPGLLGPAGSVVSADGFQGAPGIGRLGALGQALPAKTSLTLCLAVGSAWQVLPPLLAAASARTGEPAEQLALSLFHALTAQSGPGGLPATLPWVAMIEGLRAQVPDARFVVWRHEDLPQVWPQVLALLAGTVRDLPVAGTDSFALLGQTAEAQERMKRYIAAKPPPTVELMHRVSMAFANSYGSAPLHRVSDHPPLSAAVRAQIAALDQNYAAECARIGQITGVHMLG
ncbi:MAG: hypothetical protein JJU19_11875 [Pararhodobacter sp.]|nr:hypothetical protein [Pararhodobacter sp.]